MRIEAAAADAVTAGRMQLRAPEPMDQRRHEEDGGAHPFAQRSAGSGASTGFAARIVTRSSRRETSAPISTGDLEHHVHVADRRHVLENDLFVRQQGRGDHRQRGVLAAAGADLTFERSPAPDHESAQIGISPHTPALRGEEPRDDRGTWTFEPRRRESRRLHPVRSGDSKPGRPLSNRTGDARSVALWHT